MVRSRLARPLRSATLARPAVNLRRAGLHGVPPTAVHPSPPRQQAATAAVEETSDPGNYGPPPPSYAGTAGEPNPYLGAPQLLILPPEIPKSRLVFPGDVSLQDQLTLAQVCLETGDFARAKRLVQGLHTFHPEEMAQHADISFHNALLNGLMESRPRPKHVLALEWFEMLRTFHLAPNADTYAIMIKGSMHAEQTSMVAALLQDLHRRGLTAPQLLGSPYLSTADVAAVMPLVTNDSSFQAGSGTDLERFVQVQNLRHKAGAGHGPGAVQAIQNYFDALSNLTQQHEATDTTMEAVPLRSNNTLGVQLIQRSLTALGQQQYDLYEKQIRMEQDTLASYQEQLQAGKEARQDPFAHLSMRSMRGHIGEWLPRVAELIEKEVYLIDRLPKDDPAHNDRIFYGPFLKAVTPRKAALIAILGLLEAYAVRSHRGTVGHVPLASTVHHIGDRLEAEYNAIQFRKKDHAHLVPKYMATSYLSSSGKMLDMAVRRAMQKIETDQVQTAWRPCWPENVKVRVGTLLLSFILDTARLPSQRVDPGTDRPVTTPVAAFYHAYTFDNGRRLGVVRLAKETLEILSREEVQEKYSPSTLPMIVPPRPWLAHDSGGYLTLRSLSVRLRNTPDELRYLKQASRDGRLDTIHASLDTLGGTRWAINRRLFDVVAKVWNSGEGMADLPPAHLDLALPEKPANYDTDAKARIDYQRRRRAVQIAISNNHSLRCSANYKVEIARAFLDYPFYFPHNLDFRGRAYPIPPHFNHLGSDLCRGLMHFDKGRPLGPRGLRWLRIQLANLYGYDKHSFDDREQFAIDHADDIADSALNPLDGSRWWLQAEDPWQCLATCMDLHQASQCPDPSAYVSHLPVHQDGTCNGLQHYAALGCDRRGAQQVNLIPSDAPQDVYSGVLDLVKERVAQDAAEGIPQAVLLLGRINRKVIKQTVMTNVYGVTFIGAREQIYRRLREVDGLAEDQVYRCSSYLARQVFRSLGEIFHCAQQIQDWLNEAARLISSSVDVGFLTVLAQELKAEAAAKPGTTGDGSATTPSLAALNKSDQSKLARENMNSVIWTTPLNLTVVQPYRNVALRIIRTQLQTVQIADTNNAAPVNSRKQRTAFPPNFIHSLDACHMMLSALECAKQGLTFASVHDSYWTHACDVDTMNIILRDQFIALHSQPILENLHQEFQTRYGSHMIPTVRTGGKRAAAKARLAAATEGHTGVDPSATPPRTLSDMLEGLDSDSSDASYPVDSISMEDDEYLYEALATVDATTPGTTKPRKTHNKSKAGGRNLKSSAEHGLGEDDVLSSAMEEGEDTVTWDDNLTVKTKVGRKSKADAAAHKARRIVPLDFTPIVFPPLPAKGDFNIKEVAESNYFFH
ncbi:DNA-directed RNA polymerase [Tieghemiomyces parasiticus]|uniref:DNA-directed RNA polymerase n=1 Tax=Tieghemiomyces parasiticus TaxID=78921 RepID=A0A9W8E2P6_9FUNG|nr:DNA-directed RNA polymerase [Tieghemiomyces parasiticus]